MSTIETVLGIILVILCLILIACNLMKPKKSRGLTIGLGGTSNFMQDKMKNEKEIILNTIIWIAIACIIVIAVVLNYLTIASV